MGRVLRLLGASIVGALIAVFLLRYLAGKGISRSQLADWGKEIWEFLLDLAQLEESYIPISQSLPKSPKR